MEYDFQQSETINFPGPVPLLLSSTGTMKHLRLSSSMPPKTYCPSTRYPRWYFLFPTLLSSLCKTLPTLPIFPLFFFFFFPRRFLARNCPSQLQCWSLFSADAEFATCLTPETTHYVYFKILRGIQHFFHSKVTCLKPASFHDSCSEFVSPALPLSSTLPTKTVRSIIAFHKRHILATSLALLLGCE